jgi:hypothetical protein
LGSKQGPCWKNKRQIKTLAMGLDVPRRGVEGADANRQKTNSVIRTTNMFLIFILTMLRDTVQINKI